MFDDRAPAASRRREVSTMRTPDDVAAMLRLHAAGWGRRRIAAHLGCSPDTVRRCILQGGWVAYGPSKRKSLDGRQGHRRPAGGRWVSRAAVTKGLAKLEASRFIET